MEKTIVLSKDAKLSLKDFRSIVYEGYAVDIAPSSIDRLKGHRAFIQYLMQNQIEVYGITTGFADLRNKSVSPSAAATLSENMLKSHDAGIGALLPEDVVLGAMVICANSLAKGYSGFTPEGMNTLIQMINARIIPHVPSSGSLGASGDLAFLARLGRAMEGSDVLVSYKGRICTAKESLASENISPLIPQAKEGLALTNGTAFMASMAAIAYLRQLHALENIFTLEGFFLNTVSAIDAAFVDSLQIVRGQSGQEIVAKLLKSSFHGSPFVDKHGVQDDYCIRCLPQILGPRIEMILEQYPKISAELNAVTDNPLILQGDEITPDVAPERCFSFDGTQWAVLSGGNFHGEYVTVIADTALAQNAKIAITLERQLTYMLNPDRNKGKLPPYLIPDQEQVGLQSGYMIPQYTGNAVAQKIIALALPHAMFNISSGNEAEDIVSYGASAGQKWLSQLSLLEELLAIYLTVVLQAYSIRRIDTALTDDTPFEVEELFQAINKNAPDGISYPTHKDNPFAKRYEYSDAVLNSGTFSQISLLELLEEDLLNISAPTIN